MATFTIRSASVIAAALALLTSSAPGWAQDPYPDNSKRVGQRALNPRLEAPSKPDAASKGVASSLKVAPGAAGNPKALNPQPEVPSKPKKKSLKKKPAAAS
jgi:hypothetical protein